MAAVLTRVLAPARNRFLRQSDHKAQPHVGSQNKRAFERNAQADVSMGEAEEEDTTAVEDEDDDPDAEGSPDVEDEFVAAPMPEADDEVAEDEDYEEEATRGVKVRKTRVRTSGGTRRRKRGVSSQEEEEEDSPGSDEESEDEEEEQEAPWAAESEEEVIKAAEVEVANPNRCVFCDQDEDNDPSPDFEEYLACAVCGDNAHSSCAREHRSLKSDEGQKKRVHFPQYIPSPNKKADVTRWRCPACIDNGLEVDGAETQVEPPRRRRSTSKLTRELAPVVKPGAHSVFATTIIDDEADGSRALRKRKQSDTSSEEKPTMRKRRRRDASDAVIDHTLEVIKEDETGHAASREGRPSRGRPNRKSLGPLGPAFRVVEKSEDRFVVAFALRVSMNDLEHEWKKARRRERDRARRARQAQAVVVAPEPDIPHFPGIALNFTAPHFSTHDRDGEEKKPYGGILSEAEADTTRTFPQPLDRKKFEDARQKAEEEWKKKLEAARAADPAKPIPKVSGPPSRIKCINFGKFEVDTWHAAPYPEEYSRNKVLYICEFCLKYMSSDFVAWRHKLKCPAKHPPGDEIYRDGNFSFFEVDGRKNPVYCQNLCLLAKLFLGSKTLYYDVEPFLFYVMTEHDEYGEHFVGYFSKEKRPSSLNNVSCILVLPVHQRRGFGHMLIEFSYLLTKVERKTGSPEKPLSDMGLVSYRSYWRLILCKELISLHASNTPLSIADLSARTGMTADDIVSALEALRALVRDPVTKKYALRLDLPYYSQYIANYEKKGYTKINADSLVWVPYVMGKDNMHYENAPQLTTVKQREEPEEEDVALFEEAIQPEENTQQSESQSQPFAADVEDTVDPLPNDIPTFPEDEEAGPPIDPALLALDAALPSYTAMASSTPNPYLMGTTSPTSMLPNGVHPFPSLALTTPSKPRSPLKNAHLPHDTPQTSRKISANGQEESVPPTRYEVFPPLPGMGTKKKALGRPLGRGARARLAQGLGIATPSARSRRGSTVERLNGTPAGGTASVRRTRSSLAPTDKTPASAGRSLGRTRSALADNSIVQDDDDEDARDVQGQGDDGDGDVDAEGEPDEGDGATED